MLVMRRKKDQRILINGGSEKGGLTIVVCEIRGEAVRIGVEAPQSFKIFRGELVDDFAISPQSVSEEAASCVQTGQAD